MTTLQSPRRQVVVSSDAWLAFAVGVVAFLIGVVGSWRPSFWYDEAATVFSAGRPLPDLLRLLRHQDAVHGLYYLSMNGWFRLAGSSEFAARLPSALAVGVAAAGVAVLATMLGDRRTAVYSGLVFAILPRVTWAAVEAREFALPTAAATWLTVLFLIAVRRRRFGWWLGYLLGAVLLTAAFIPAAFLVMAHGVTLWWRRDFRSAKAGFIAAAVGAGLVSGPFVVFVQGQSGEVDWIPPLDGHVFRSVGEYQWFVGAPVFAVLFAGLLVVGAVLTRARGAVVALAVPWAVVPTVALIAYSLRSPYYVDRYLTFATPAIALLGGAALVSLARLRAWLPVVVLIALAVAALPNYTAQRGDWPKPSEMDFSDVAAFVQRHAQPGDCVAFAEHVSWNPTSARVALNAHPEAFAGLRDVSLGQSALGPGWLWDQTLPPAAIPDRLADCAVLWFVTDTERAEPRTIRHTSNEVWRLPPYHFANSDDFAQLRAQGFGVDEQFPIHMSQVVRLTR
ncbi:MAG: glycosyltransferase family 39 protein [Aldersonia sp.]|nr:glycosyltransferase family 39 protein [Aldersonia sp.]